MPTVRVYLLTYRRAYLLPRALASLRAQTFTDWICELHNDDPDDALPGQMAAKTGDPRIRFVQHNENLGPNRTFNLVFQPCAERYVCLLEDDNWWEPTFLETLVALLDNTPSAHVAWSNLRIWRENADTTWTDTGRTQWPIANFSDPTWFRWPDDRHVDSLLHSNGSALIRNTHLADLIVPPSTPFLAMEPIRERAMRFPLLFCPQPLVNFAWTLATARESSSRLAAEMKALMTAAYLRHADLDTAGYARLVKRARQASPVSEVGGLLVAARLAGRTGNVARHVYLAEWPRLLASFLRHACTNIALLRARRSHPEIWAYLDLHTRRRFIESVTNST